MSNYHRILSQFINRPLFVHPRTAVTVFNALSNRFGMGMMPDVTTPDAEIVDASWQNGARGERMAVRASRFEGEMVRNQDGGFPRVEPFMRTPDGVGVITIDGELVNRGAWVGADASGAVSYEGTKFAIQRAAKDPKTKAILLDLNSPGGEAVGMDDVAKTVRAAREIKPVYAVVNGMAASAGYGIASGATRIFTGPTGLAGSIGVVMMHLDMSKAMEKEGMSPTFIYAGAHKVDGNFAEPLSDDVKSELQQEINSFYSLFVETVAAGRGRRLSAKAARETEARTFIGQAAVDAGVADAVGSFDDVLAETTSMVRRKSASKSNARNQSMKNGPQNGALGIDDAGDDAAHAQAVAAARDEGHKAGLAEGRTEGMKAANTRLAAILGDEKVKGREMHALRLAMKSPDMSAEDIVDFCAGLPVETPPVAATAPKTIGDRVSGTGVDGVTSAMAGGPHGAPETEGERSQLDWSKHTSAIIEQRKAATSRR